MPPLSRFAHGFMTVTLLIAASIGVSACSNYAVPTYSPSATTVSTLRGDSGAVQVYLEPFTASEGVTDDLMCRLAGQIELPGGKSWTGYIREALKSELLMAERYTDTSQTDALHVAGTLERATFSSTQGYWELVLRLEFPDGGTVSETVRYSFDPSWVGTDACDAVADAFEPAVHKLIEEMVENPRFRDRLGI